MTNPKIHGRWDISVNNLTLIMNISDSWNEEAAIKFSKELKEKAMPLTNGKWSIISIMDKWELATPDCQKHIIELSQWLVDHGCVRECHVFEGSALKQMIIENYKAENFDQNALIRRSFIDVKDAVSWLNSSGFTVEL